MSKNIIFCADGTWNGPGQDAKEGNGSYPTNVFKLFVNLAGIDSLETMRLANEQERISKGNASEVDQIAKYIHGVGDSDNALVRLLGGTLGEGIIIRIVRGYTFISRNYSAGDKIFIIGFSRGAYTARALAGMIVTKGLLDASQLDLTDKKRAYQLGAAVWYDYRRTALKTNPDWVGQLEELAAGLPDFISDKPTSKMIQDVRLEAVAVWDTVGSLGIPQYTRSGTCVDVFRFADTKLSDKVARGFHAVSLDEQRGNFTPTLWDADPRITQVLFPGAHADVGGGYPMTNNESGLSDGAFDWMMGELSEGKNGIKFLNPLTLLPRPDAAGTAHQPWLAPPWPGLPSGPRTFSPTMKLVLDPSIEDRTKRGPVRADPSATPAVYGPRNIPQ